MSDYGYTLDATSARNAESIGKFIRDTGKYKGVFTRAEMLISKNKGTQGIEFDFLSDGKECTLQLWTRTAQGEPLSAINMVNALMTCLSLRSIQPKKMVVEKYDYDTKQRRKVEIDAFPDLMNKPIGLLLQKELSIYEGKEKSKMLIFAAFNHASEKTATEIIDKAANPVSIGKLVLGLTDKDNRKAPSQTPQPQSKTNNAYAALDDDSDLPF